MAEAENLHREAETWREVVLHFESACPFRDPVRDCCIVADFTGPEGMHIQREAFWDGGRRFCVSFAAPRPGTWTWKLAAPPESGLDGKSGTIVAAPYSGNLPIYQHGFLRCAKAGELYEGQPLARNILVHADGMPFFWLGDTHWEFALGESWDASNHAGMRSQFRGMADKRAEQGFTVYQTNLRSDFHEHSRFWLTREDAEHPIPNPAVFAEEIDRRMHYIADLGFVNALGFAWGSSVEAEPDAFGAATTLAEQKTLARYCAARYGALPLVWTIAGEASGYDPSRHDFLVSCWSEAARTVRRHDAYRQPCTVHSVNERPFSDCFYGETWYDFTLNQAGHGDFVVAESDYRDFMERHPEKPFVEGEALYEGCSSLEENGSRRIDASMLRRVAYITMQLGGAGYTYGAQGIWDNIWSQADLSKSPMARMMTEIFNRYGVTWTEAIDFPGADQMGIMRRFFEEQKWWTLEPYGKGGSALLGRKAPLAAKNADGTHAVAYYAATTRKPLELAGLKDGSWLLRWFDPVRGVYAGEEVRQISGGRMRLPDKPTMDDWLLVLNRADGLYKMRMEQSK